MFGRFMQLTRAAVSAGCLLAAAGGAFGQDASSPAAAPSVPEPTATEAPESLKIYFDTGSARIREDQAITLDTAARLFREGSPIVMIVSGLADTVGQPETNLDLSIRRAMAVADGLVAHGIPAARLQVLGRGNSDLEVDTGDGVPEPENRIAEITWR